MAYKAIFLRSPPRTDCTARGRCFRISMAMGLVWLLPRLTFETIFLLNLPSLKVTRTTEGESELLQPTSFLVHLFTAASSGISFEGEVFLLYSFRILPHRIFTKETGLPFIASSPPLLPATTTHAVLLSSNWGSSRMQPGSFYPRIKANRTTFQCSLRNQWCQGRWYLSAYNLKMYRQSRILKP